MHEVECERHFPMNSRSVALGGRSASEPTDAAARSVIPSQLFIVPMINSRIQIHES